MNNIKQLARQTIIYGFGTIIPRLINFLLTPYFTWIFSKGEYGVFTELYAYTAFLLVVLLYGMETSFFYFSEKNKNNKSVYSTALSSISITSFLFITIGIVFADKIADIIDYSSNVEYIRWFALIIGIDSFLAIPFANLRRQNKALKFSILKIINVLIYITSIFFFLLVIPKVNKNLNIEEGFLIGKEQSKIGYIFISNLIASTITLLLLLPEICKIKLNVNIRLLKEMLFYAFPLLIVGLAGMINEVADKFMLKYLVVNKENAIDMVGIYGANYKIAMIMTIFVQMFRYAAEPFFFAQFKYKDSKKIYAEVMNYFVISGLLIFLFVMLFIDIVKYFIGPDFHSGLQVVPIILIANLFYGIFYNLSVWYKVNNKTKFGAYIAVIGATITISLNIILVPKIGYMGAAWATLVCYFSMSIISFFLGRKYYKIDYNIKKFGFYFILALFLFFINNLINIENIKWSILVSTFLLGVYIIIINRKERILNFLQKNENKKRI